MPFFEQLGKRLTDAGQSVAQQTKNFADVTQLNSAVSDKEKKISQLYLNMGRLYYEKHKNDLSADFRPLMEEITALYAEIAENRDKIKQIKGIAQCPKCGANLPANAAFCHSCGAKLERDSAVSGSNTAQRCCPVCHAMVDAGNAFCNHCGAKLDSQ